MCTINENLMLYFSWHMECDRQNVLSFWAIFCSFTSLTTQKIKILKKWKKTTGYFNILHKRTRNHDNIVYCSWDMASDACNCCFSFWAIFCPFTSLAVRKIKIKKKMKKENHHFTQVYHKSWSYARLFLRYSVWRM